MTSPGPTRAEPNWTRVDSAIVAGTMLLAASIFFYRIGSSAIWLDEGTTYYRSSLPLPALVKDAIGHWHVPTYFILMRPVLALGDSETWLRLPSAICSVCAVGVSFVLGRIARDRFAGGIAAVLMALSPFQREYAQEARMYGMLVLAATVAWTGVIWLVKHPERAGLPLLRRNTGGHFEPTSAWPAWLACISGLIVALFLHNIATLYAAATALVALGALLTARDRRALFRNWAAAGGIVALFYGWWVFVLLGQVRTAHNQQWGSTKARAIAEHAGNLFALPVTHPVWSTFGVALVLWALFASYRGGTLRIATSLLGIAVFPLVFSVLAPVNEGIFSARTLIGCAPAAHVLLALGVSYLATPLATIAVLVLIGAGTTAPAKPDPEAWHDLLPKIERRWRSGGLVVSTGGRERKQLQYYYHRRDRPYPARPFVVATEENALAQTAGARILYAVNLARRKDEAAPVHAALARAWTVRRKTEVRGIELVEYRRKGRKSRPSKAASGLDPLEEPRPSRKKAKSRALDPGP